MLKTFNTIKVQQVHLEGKSIFNSKFVHAKSKLNEENRGSVPVSPTCSYRPLCTAWEHGQDLELQQRTGIESGPILPSGLALPSFIYSQPSDPSANPSMSITHHTSMLSSPLPPCLLLLRPPEICRGGTRTRSGPGEGRTAARVRTPSSKACQ